MQISAIVYSTTLSYKCSGTETESKLNLTENSGLRVWGSGIPCIWFRWELSRLGSINSLIEQNHVEWF